MSHTSPRRAWWARRSTLLGQLVPSERFQRLDNAGVQHPPPLLEQAAIGHLVREGVLEGVLPLGEQPRLVQELRRLEVREASVQLPSSGTLGNGLQQRQGHLCADDRGRLEELFLLRRQPVNTCREDCLYRGGHLDARERLGQPIRPRLADQDPVSTSVRTLSSRKKGLPCGARDQELA